MPRLAVLGQPVAHSRSPAMHAAALRALGLAAEWSYEAIAVSPDELEARVRAMPGEGFAGANVTVPHKVAALRLAERASERARAIGAANTLTFIADRVEAENTDAPALIDSMPSTPAGERALVLGAGGSARACAWALRHAGAEVSVWNRTQERAEQLAAELGINVLDVDPRGQHSGVEVATAHAVIVNATTVGLAAANAAPGETIDPAGDLKALPFDADSLGERHVVVDLVYGPLATPLATVARERGATVVDGLEVLAHQGARSLRSWTGLDPPLDVMREAARNF